jgi:hypothetical protein
LKSDELEGDAQLPLGRAGLPQFGEQVDLGQPGHEGPNHGSQVGPRQRRLFVVQINFIFFLLHIFISSYFYIYIPVCWWRLMYGKVRNGNEEQTVRLESLELNVY